MSQLRNTRALLSTASDLAAAERAEAVQAGHVLRAIGYCTDPEVGALVERFPSLAAAEPAPTRPRVARLRSRPKPSAQVRAAAERAFAAAARAGGAPSPLDLLAELASDPANRDAFSAAQVARSSLREWLDARRYAA